MRRKGVITTDLFTRTISTCSVHKLAKYTTSTFRGKKNAKNFVLGKKNPPLFRCLCQSKLCSNHSRDKSRLRYLTRLPFAISDEKFVCNMALAKRARVSTDNEDVSPRPKKPREQDFRDKYLKVPGITSSSVGRCYAF